MCRPAVAEHAPNGPKNASSQIAARALVITVEE
jgi:hypothetical protein